MDWAEKYRPATLSGVLGNDAAVSKLREWARTWSGHRRPALLSGSPERGIVPRLLLTVEHPRSIRTIGWTRTFGNCRVFDFQPGHDPVAWNDRSFRAVLRRGILWCARKL